MAIIRDVLPDTILAQVDNLDALVSDKVKVSVACACGAVKEVSTRALKRKWANQPVYLCKSCHIKTYASKPDRITKFQKSFAKIAKTESHRKKCSEAGKKPWRNPESRARIIEATRQDNKINPLKKRARKIALEALKAKPWFLQHMDNMRQSAQKACVISRQNNPELWRALANNFRLDEDEIKEKHRISTIEESRRRWADPEFRRRMMELFNSPEITAKLSARAKQMWANTDYRTKMLALYASPEYKARKSAISKEVNQRTSVKIAKAEALLRQNPISKLEDVLASILSDRNIKYDRQFMLAWHLFDFRIKVDGANDILLEVNGDWFHSNPKQIQRDIAKRTFVERYHSDKFILHTIWEREFASPERLNHILDEMLSPSALEDFNFDDIIAQPATDSTDTKILLGKYHYMGGIGRYRIIVEYRLGDELVASVVFAHPTRDETRCRLGVDKGEILELTRMCIAPRRQKKNFASWILARAVKMAKTSTRARCLVSFADQTFDHSGTAYKAAGWEYDGETTPSYYYRDPDGFVMHKKTLYNKARGVHMVETEYADKYKYVRVKTKNKHRFVKWIRS